MARMLALPFRTFLGRWAGLGAIPAPNVQMHLPLPPMPEPSQSPSALPVLHALLDPMFPAWASLKLVRSPTASGEGGGKRSNENFPLLGMAHS